MVRITDFYESSFGHSWCKKLLGNCKNCAGRDKITSVHPALLFLIAFAKQLSMQAGPTSQSHTPYNDEPLPSFHRHLVRGLFVK